MCAPQASAVENSANTRHAAATTCLHLTQGIRRHQTRASPRIRNLAWASIPEEGYPARSTRERVHGSAAPSAAWPVAGHGLPEELEATPPEAETTSADDAVSEGSAVPPSHVIREGHEADIEQCVALALVANPERSASDWRSSIARDIENREHHLVVAERRGEVIGYARARLFEPEPQAPADTAPRGYYLSGLFVVSHERHAGIGAALTQARLDWISDRAAEAWFFANARNSASIALHERFGFEEATRHFCFPGLTFEGGEGILFRLSFDHRA